MRVTWHPQAEEELIESARFYDQRVAGLGADFLDAVDATIDQIASDPQRFQIVEHGIQRCRMKRFPYCVYFRYVSSGIRILIVKHHSRDLHSWKTRR